MQATVWVSDTSAVCKTSGGVDGSMVLAVTAGGRGGSFTESVSFDGSMASSVAGTNEGGTGGGSLTVSGADFGTSRWGVFLHLTPKMLAVCMVYWLVLSLLKTEEKSDLLRSTSGRG